jgi:hypothetical protein
MVRRELVFVLDEDERTASCYDQLNPPGKMPSYPLCRRLGGFHSYFRCSGSKEKNLNIEARNQTVVIQSTAHDFND